MFELHPTILVLNLAHYPGWCVNLAGRDGLPPLPKYYRYHCLAARKLSIEHQLSYHTRFFTSLTGDIIFSNTQHYAIYT